MRPSQRQGVTLVELVVVILLIGLMATVAGLGVPRAEHARLTNSLLINIAGARQASIDSGTAITRVIVVRGRPYAVTALPDGSVIADTSLLVDRLTGMVGSADKQAVRNPRSPHDTSAR